MSVLLCESMVSFVAFVPFPGTVRLALVDSD